MKKIFALAIFLVLTSSKAAFGFLVPELYCVCIDYATGRVIYTNDGDEYVMRFSAQTPHGMLCPDGEGQEYEGQTDPDPAPYKEARLTCGPTPAEAYENVTKGAFALWSKKVKRSEAISLERAFGGLGLPPIDETDNH